MKFLIALAFLVSLQAQAKSNHMSQPLSKRMYKIMLITDKAESNAGIFNRYEKDVNLYIGEGVRITRGHIIGTGGPAERGEWLLCWDPTRVAKDSCEISQVRFFETPTGLSAKLFKILKRAHELESQQTHADFRIEQSHEGQRYSLSSRLDAITCQSRIITRNATDAQVFKCEYSRFQN